MKFKDFLSNKGVEDIATLDAEKQAELYNEYNAAEKVRLEELIENKASKEDIDAIKVAMAENAKKQFDALNDALKKEHGILLKKVSDSEAQANKNWKSAMKSELLSQIDELRKLKQENLKQVMFPVTAKAAGTMTISGNVSGGNIPVEDRIPGLDTIASRQIRLLDIVSRRATSSNVVSWVSQANKDGAAGQTGEGAAKNQIDFDLTVVNESIEKTTAYIKVSTEMLDDIDYIQSEIEGELLRELLKVVEAQVYEGDGTGNNLNGIRTVASAFSPGASWTGAVDNANVIDVLVAAVDQIMVANQPMPNYVLMHPTDVNKLKTEKVSATDKRYIERLQMVAGNLVLDGVTTIVPTTLVTVDEYLIGYFDFAELWEKGSISVQIGLDSDDFTKNTRTILAEWRGLALVKTNKRTAFVKGTFATDKATLETT